MGMLPIPACYGQHPQRFCVPNRKKYQANEYITDLGLNWMDFNARQYDPQIGRFLGVDPKAASGGQEIFSPYAAMGNAPESMVDPNGDAFSYYGTPNFNVGVDNGPKPLAERGNNFGNTGDVPNADDFSKGFAGDEEEGITQAEYEMWAAVAAGTNNSSAQGSTDPACNDMSSTADGDVKTNETESNTNTEETGSDPGPDILEEDPTKDPNVKKYEANNTKMNRNSMKIDALSKLTKVGQLQHLIDVATERWEKCCGKYVPPAEKDRMVAELDKAFSALGIAITTAEPKVQIAATITSGRYQAENFYLYGINEYSLKPKIEAKFPGYFDVAKPQWTGGGGSGGGY